MTLDELKNRVTKAVTSISGEFADQIVPSYYQQVLENFATLENGKFVVTTPDEVIIKTLDGAPSRYDGQTKRPNQAFWKRIKRDKQSFWNSQHGVRSNSYVKPTEDEIILATKIAREAQNKFKELTPTSVGLSRRSSKAEQRVTSNKLYATKGLVCIQDSTSEMNGLWVSRGEAVGGRLKFHDPVKWLNDRAKNGDVSRGTFKTEVEKMESCK